MNMKNTPERLMSKILALALSFSFFATASAVPALPVSAAESIGNGLILSTDAVTVTEAAATATFTAMLEEGFDASRLACVVADPDVASVTPVAAAANVAAFQVSYGGSGTTAAAVYHLDNPAVVAYLTIQASAIIMEIPAKLGTNHKNYCILTSCEFVPYDFTYSDFNDYKYTLNIKYRCASYKDRDFAKWGCYGFFYDAAGNVLAKVHLYCSSLAEGSIYHSEFNVPLNAVRFSIEGFDTE